MMEVNIARNARRDQMVDPLPCCDAGTDVGGTDGNIGQVQQFDPGAMALLQVGRSGSTDRSGAASY